MGLIYISPSVLSLSVQSFRSFGEEIFFLSAWNAHLHIVSREVVEVQAVGMYDSMTP